MSHSAYPGDSYEDAFLRIKQALALDEQSLKEISDLSEASFREWLNTKATEIAVKLGYAVGVVMAYIQDLLSIASNFSTSFEEGFRKGYQKTVIAKKRK